MGAAVNLQPLIQVAAIMGGGWILAIAGIVVMYRAGSWERRMTRLLRRMERRAACARPMSSSAR